MYGWERMRTVSFLLTLLSLLFAVKAEIFASCNTLSFQWNHNPVTGNVLEGTLSVTREANTEREYGKFNLGCNDNVRIVNPPPTSNISIPAHVGTLVNYSLELSSVTQPSNCHFQYCFTRSFEVDCTFAVCNFTLPQSYPQWISNSYTEPVYFQWIPINSESGDLIVTYYNIKKGTDYKYGISCHGLTLRNYGLTFSYTSSGDGMRSYRVLNATLSISTTVFPTQYTCLLSICLDGPGDCQGGYNLVIPDVDITDRTLIMRPNLLYYYWQKPTSAIELKVNGSRINCDNIKFYWIMDNTHQGQLIIQYNIPSTMHSLQGQFSVSCGAQVRQAELPVSLQRYLGTITMIFTLEYYGQDTFCSTNLCLYEGSGAERKCSRQESYCSPIVLFNNSIQEETVAKNYVTLREAEPCHVNTWVWVVYGSREGEANFILGKDILAATKYGGKITLSCGSLTVISLNPQSIQYVLQENGGIASFIIAQNTKYSNGSQKCVLDVCALVYGGCNLIYKCYITIPVYQGDLLTISDQLNKLKTCPQSLWHWRHTSSGGVLTITIRQEDRGVISIDCNGIIVDGHNELDSTHTGVFYLIKSLHGQSAPYCNIRICVKQDQFIGCKKSLNCVVTIPSNVATRAARSYEEPSEELLANCERENLGPDSPVSSCSDKMWDIFYNNGYSIGEVSLRIILQGNDKMDEFLRISLRCSGLDLKGSTEYKLVVPKMQKETTVEFNISLPKSTEETQTHQCIVETQRRPKSLTEQANNTMCPTTASCSISVRTVLGRILPKCNATEGRRSIHQVYTVYNQAKVEITVSASPNHVYTVDPYCNKNNPFGHNTTKELLTNTFPSTTTGEGKVTIAISFYPECDNKTIASYFVNKRLEDCHMDVYWYCQGGEQVIENIKNLQFADEPMYCEPKSIAKRLIMSLQKTFGVYSEPIAILLAILIGVASLYVLLIPGSIILAYCHCREKLNSDSYHECEDDEWNDDVFCEKRNSTKPLVSTYH